MNEIHSKRYEVHVYEVDFAGKAQLLVLLNYLQHAAAEQAGKLGFGFDDLIKKNLAWILSRYHIKVARYPELGDKIEVSYRAEAFYGEEVISRIQRQGAESDLTFLHQIVNRKTGAELARLRTVWG